MSKHQITLHHLNFSRSERLFWVLEELGHDYNVKVYYRTPSRSAPPELKKISPFGKAPVLELDGEVISESAYIIHRLLGLGPSDSVETQPSNDSIYWSHFSEASQMDLMQAGAILGATSAGFSQMVLKDDAGKEAVKSYNQWVQESYLRPQNQTNLDQIEDFFSKTSSPFFSGSEKPGIGDFMMCFVFNSLFNGTRKDSGYRIGPKTTEWFKTISARPGYQKGIKRLQTEEEAQKSKM